ncbi:MAG: rhomboid family intramembrane serine protease [Candidatus Brocadiia bacterium]
MSGLGQGSGVTVDQCVQCSGLFLDHGEFTRLRRHFGGAGGQLEGRPVPAGPSPKVMDGDSLGIVILQYVTGVPLEVDTPQVVFPPAVLFIVVVNAVVLTIALLQGLREWVFLLGMVPADIRRGWRLWTLLTSMFMHGGPFHLLGNMLFLYILGDNLESRFGWWRFLLFYVVCGLVANLVYVFSATQPHLPSVGASGAVSGVLGAYLVLWPGRRLLIRIFYFLWVHSRIEVPVWVYLGFWILMQLALAQLDVPGVAWMAHVGGFACGVVIGLSARWLAHWSGTAPGGSAVGR